MVLVHMHHSSTTVALAFHLRFHRTRDAREANRSFALYRFQLFGHRETCQIVRDGDSIVHGTRVLLRFLCGNKSCRVFRVPFPYLSSIPIQTTLFNPTVFYRKPYRLEVDGMQELVMGDSFHWFGFPAGVLQRPFHMHVPNRSMWSSSTSHIPQLFQIV